MDRPDIKSSPGFSVDTGLFRQLGELLVGRDSTALAELVKNAYDADATDVILITSALNDASAAFVKIVDNGTGMTAPQFRHGFLRIAGRTKSSDGRTSPVFGRRYTGEKGVGRLAAHKLAASVHVQSIAAITHSGRAAVAALRNDNPDLDPNDLLQNLDGERHTIVDARINWDIIERFETLDQIDNTALVVRDQFLRERAPRGTTITLRNLRRAWTDRDLGDLARQLGNFEPPAFLLKPFPRGLLPHPGLFDVPAVRDASRQDPGMRIHLDGDLGTPTDYWSSVERTAEWVLDIRADHGNDIEYIVTPTRRQTADNIHSQPVHAKAPHPNPTVGPFFQARIMIRSGATPTVDEQSWASQSSGVRIYLEGFRVLPYGEPGNDWLGLDMAYTRRSGRFNIDPLLGGRGDTFDALSKLNNRDISLRLLPNRAFFGAVFLTDKGANALRTLVNREGFVPDSHFEVLTNLVRQGTDLALRARALASLLDRRERDRERALAAAQAESFPEQASAVPNPKAIGLDFTPMDDPLPRNESEDSHYDFDGVDPEAWRYGRQGSAARLLAALTELRAALPSNPSEQLLTGVDRVERAGQSLASDASLLRVLASVGSQLAGFHHEVQHMLPTARALEQYLAPKIGTAFPTGITEARRDMQQLRRSLERHASYLTDVVSAKARERRSRQTLRDRFDVAARTLEAAAATLSVTIENNIPADLRTPPMFPAEVLAVLTNLLTNAIKAAGKHGKVRATGSRGSGKSVILRLENTGAPVNPSEGERWFVPFASSSAAVDVTLGQGIGLGLPIVRDLLAEYGSSVRFVTPANGFATAVEVRLVA